MKLQRKKLNKKRPYSISVEKEPLTSDRDELTKQVMEKKDEKYETPGPG